MIRIVRVKKKKKAKKAKKPRKPLIYRAGFAAGYITQSVANVKDAFLEGYRNEKEQPDA